MNAAKYDIELEFSSKFDMTVVWRDENGNPYDLTGATARLVVGIPGTTALIACGPATSVSGFNAAVGTTDGKIQFTADADKLTSLSFDRARYNIMVSISGGNPATAPDSVRLMEGVVVGSAKVPNV